MESDVTVRQGAEEALRESEEKYRALFSEMDEAYAVVEVMSDATGRWTDFRFLDVNPAFMRHTGMPYPVGRTATELLGTPNPRWAELYGRVAATGESMRLEEPELTLGRVFDLNIFRLGGEGSRRVAVLFTDVTTRKHAEAALRASEARFRALTDLVPDLIWESAVDGSTDWYNARWLEYTGQTLEEAQGWGWTEAIHPDDRARSAANYARAAEMVEPLVQEHRIRRHDGSYRWFLVHADPLRDESGRIVRWLGAATDIHERRMALQEAERLAADRTAERDAARRQLLEAEEVERRRLARELHDEAGQHLTALGLGLQTLSDMTPPGSEVDRRATHLREIAATMSRELHALAVRLRPRSLDDFGLEAALAAYAEEWTRQTGTAVALHARSGADRLPSAIESTVYRVVQEALTNVARHSGAARTSVIVERRDGQVVTIIEDDGRGFDVDALSRSPREVSGLGLRGIRERAALLGGTADFESTPGGGTTVFVRIPIDASATVPTGARRDVP